MLSSNKDDELSVKNVDSLAKRRPKKWKMIPIRSVHRYLVFIRAVKEDIFSNRGGG